MYFKMFGLLACSLGIPFLLFAQKSFTISGNIVDASNGEELIGATVLVKELGTGTITNEYGFYSITLPPETYTLSISYVGYETVSQQIELNQNQRLNQELIPRSGNLEEVVVLSESPDANIQSTTMGVNRLDISEIEVLPVVFGEKDVI